MKVPFETRQEEKATLAAFGNVTYETGAWEWGLGLASIAGNPKKKPSISVTRHRKTMSKCSPNVSVTRHFDNDSMAYATDFKRLRARRLGGHRRRRTACLSAQWRENPGSALNPEEAIQYEVGWKGSLADGRVSSTAAVFFIDYDQRQFEFIVPNPSGDGTLIDGIENIGDSEQTGDRVGLTWQASDYLQVAAAYGYIDAEWDSNTILPDGSANLGGQTPPQIIETQYDGDRQLSECRHLAIST